MEGRREARTRRRRRAAGAAVLIAALVVVGRQAADGVAVNRRWMTDPYRSEAALAADLAECLRRAISRVVPEGARVHVSKAEAAVLSEVYFLQLVEYAYRRATLVDSPSEADLLLTVVLTPGRGCGGVDAAVRPGDRPG